MRYSGLSGPDISCVSSLQVMVKTADVTKALSWLGLRREGTGRWEEERIFFYSRGENVSVIDTGSLKIDMLRAQWPLA